LLSAVLKQKWDPTTTIAFKPKTPDFPAFVSYFGATATQFTLLVAALHVLQLKLLNHLSESVLFTLPALSTFPFLSTSITTPSIILSSGATFKFSSLLHQACCLPSSITLPLVTFPALSFPSIAKVASELAFGSSAANIIVFFTSLFLAVRSRVFSPLNNSRPKASSNDPVFKGRARPWFQPPPQAFPVIWSTIALLRAFSTTLVFNTNKTLLSPGVFALMLHLSVGDTWNTINNVEKRMGTAALFVPAVLASAVFAVQQMGSVSPTAGFVLAPMAIWLSVANLLVWSIWRLNYLTFNRPSLFPSVEEGPACPWRLPLTSFNS